MLNRLEKTFEPRIQRLIDRVESELKKILANKLKKVILFGSYSRGDYDHESDIDMIALVNEPQPEEKYEEELLDVIVDLSIEFEVVLSLFLESEAEYERAKESKPLLRSIEKEGVEIYAA